MFDIADLLAGGMSQEDIAKHFTEELNEAVAAREKASQKENEKKAAAQAFADAFSTLIKNFYPAIWNSLDKEDYGADEVIEATDIIEKMLSSSSMSSGFFDDFSDTLKKLIGAFDEPEVEVEIKGEDDCGSCSSKSCSYRDDESWLSQFFKKHYNWF